jgi:hypothetical protein
MKKTILASLVAAAVVGACGGGDDNPAPPPPTAPVPLSASQSVDGFISYLKLLVATAPADADVLEPVDTSTVTGPTDETSEPQVVD